MDSGTEFLLRQILMVRSAFWRVSNHEALLSASSFETPLARLLRMREEGKLLRSKIRTLTLTGMS